MGTIENRFCGILERHGGPHGTHRQVRSCSGRSRSDAATARMLRPTSRPTTPAPRLGNSRLRRQCRRRDRRGGSMMSGGVGGGSSGAGGAPEAAARAAWQARRDRRDRTHDARRRRDPGQASLRLGRHHRQRPELSVGWEAGIVSSTQPFKNLKLLDHGTRSQVSHRRSGDRAMVGDSAHRADSQGRRRDWRGLRRFAVPEQHLPLQRQLR